MARTRKDVNRLLCNEHSKIYALLNKTDTYPCVCDPDKANIEMESNALVFICKAIAEKLERDDPTAVLTNPIIRNAMPGGIGV